MSLLCVDRAAMTVVKEEQKMADQTEFLEAGRAVSAAGTPLLYTSQQRAEEQVPLLCSLWGRSTTMQRKSTRHPNISFLGPKPPFVLDCRRCPGDTGVDATRRGVAQNEVKKAARGGCECERGECADDVDLVASYNQLSCQSGEGGNGKWPTMVIERYM